MIPLATANAVSIPTPEEEEQAEAISLSTSVESTRALEAQVEDRPLAKKQEELQTIEEDKVVETRPAARKALLTNDDHELKRVADVSSCFD